MKTIAMPLTVAMLLSTGSLAMAQTGAAPPAQSPHAQHGAPGTSAAPAPPPGPGQPQHKPMMGHGAAGMMCPMMAQAGGGAGGMQGDMGMGQGMMGMGPGMMAGADPKAQARMLKMRGEMMKAMGEIMMKHGEALEREK